LSSNNTDIQYRIYIPSTRTLHSDKQTYKSKCDSEASVVALFLLFTVSSLGINMQFFQTKCSPFLIMLRTPISSAMFTEWLSKRCPMKFDSLLPVLKSLKCIYTFHIFILPCVSHISCYSVDS